MAQVLNYARLKHIPAGAVYIGRGMPNIPEIRNSKTRSKCTTNHNAKKSATNTATTCGPKFSVGK